MRHVMWALLILTVLVQAQRSALAADLAIYGRGVSLVTEERKVTLKPGRNIIPLAGLPETVVRGSLSVTPGMEAARVDAISRNDSIISNESLLRAHIGRNVTLIRTNPATGAVEKSSAALVSVRQGVVVKEGGLIYAEPDGRIAFPAMPEGMVAEPAYEAVIENSSPDTVQTSIVLMYMAEGIGFRPNYILTLLSDGRAQIEGYADIDNISGADYPDAHVRLVAGDPNLPNFMDEPGGPARGLVMMESARTAAPAADKKSFEYHVYEPSGNVPVLRSRTLSVPLIAPAGIGVSRKYVHHGWDLQPVRDGASEVRTLLELTVEDLMAINTPLASGPVRIYDATGGGGAIFAGQDTIPHTPVGQGLTLNAGAAFDIRAKRVRTLYRKISEGTMQAGFEITFTNRGDEDITVTDVEHLSGDFDIMYSSHKPVRTSADEVTFAVFVAAGGDAVLSYTARLNR